MSEHSTPYVMYLLFERGVFLGAFKSRKVAKTTRDSRKTAGKPKAKLVKFVAVPDIESD